MAPAARVLQRSRSSTSSPRRGARRTAPAAETLPPVAVRGHGHAVPAGCTPSSAATPRYLDVLGLNYYHDNQWYFGSGPQDPAGPPRLPAVARHAARLAPALRAADRDRRDGDRGGARPRWLRFVCREVDAACRRARRSQAVCLYPIVNHPGWTNDRHCHNGLWDYADAQAAPQTTSRLARELRRRFGRTLDARIRRPGGVQDDRARGASVVATSATSASSPATRSRADSSR